jgi:hypothetical protein
MNGKNTITNSERGTADCPHRWLLRYGLGLRPVTRTRVLDLGSLVHAGLDAYYGAPVQQGEEAFVTPNPLQDGLAAIESELQAQLAKVREAQDSGLVDPANFVPQTAVDGLLEDADNAARLLAGYHMTWDQRPFKVLASEQTYTRRVRTPSGHVSTRTWYAGKVDKVVEYQGHTLVLEHKTTSLALGEWHEKHRRSPQARAYGWLLRECGIPVTGVVYDLIQSKPPKPWSGLQVLKDGTKLAKPAGLPWTTAEEFLLAVQQVRGGAGQLTDVEWYAEVHRALRERDADGFWYRREVELFDDADMQRIEAEIYHAATGIRRWRERVERVREATQHMHTEEEWRDGVIPVLQALGPEFPRSSGQCWQYNRLCQYASLCHSQSAHDLQGFQRFGGNGHPELDLPNT